MPHDKQLEPSNDNDMDQKWNRRMFLRATGILAAGALAGCLPQAESQDVALPSTTGGASPASAPPAGSAATQVPPPTLIPTQAPPPTQAPTQVPPPTQAPTQAPTAVEPTETSVPTPTPAGTERTSDSGVYVITALCLRDSACVDVCPVEAIVGGKPERDWPWYMIDPDNCISCGACVPECPYEAIFVEGDVPAAYTMKEGQYLNDTKERLPQGGPLEGEVNGHPVKVANAWAPGAGYVADLTPAIAINGKFYKEGPGYSAR